MAEVLAVVQCRYASTRLPGKALLPMAGMPMLVLLLRRLLAARLPVHLVLATTTRPEDDAVAAWGRSEGVAVVRGAEDDVLDRFLQCLREYPAAGAVRVTADNPLTAPQALAAVAAALDRGEADYVSALEGWITGVGVDGFAAATLQALDRQDLTPAEREHLNARILARPGEFSRCYIPAPAGLEKSGLSLTVDTPRDYALVRELVESGHVPEPLEELTHAVAATGRRHV